MGLTDKYPDIISRYVEQAHHQDKNIKDFSDFANALKDYLGESKSGQEGALSYLEEEDWKALWESKTNRELMKPNLTEADFKEKFRQTDDEVQSDTDYSIISRKGKGMKTTKQDILIIRTPKQIQVKGYKTHTGRETHFYVKGYSKWTSNEETYLKEMKQKNIPYNQALTQYRARFRTSERTTQSLKTKFYRV
jgi:hypothetical protein